VYICLFADCKASPVRPIGDVTEGEHIKLQMLKLQRYVSANENTKGCWKKASS